MPAGHKVKQKTSSTMQSLLRRAVDTLTPSSSQTSVPRFSAGTDFLTAPDEKSLFPVVDPTVDGEDCDKDCDSCSIHYPAKFSIEESDELFGHVKGWSTHLLVATGKADWTRDVENEKGSIMEAVGKEKEPENGRLMLSASNIPVPDHYHDHPPGQQPTDVILLPAFTVLENIKPSDVHTLIRTVVSTAPTNTTRYNQSESTALSTTASADPTLLPASSTTPTEIPVPPPSLPFPSHPVPHIALILLCSQKTRDARCGQSAPLLRREFERHLRPLGLYRDLHDKRPGGVGIYFISHVGGHKYSANVMVYRRGGDAFKRFQPTATTITSQQNGSSSSPSSETQPQPPQPTSNGTAGDKGNATTTGASDQGAAQCIWLARVRPEDCEAIVKFTVLQGKVRKPESQLRGGFDRERGLVSW